MKKDASTIRDKVRRHYDRVAENAAGERLDSAQTVSTSGETQSVARIQCCSPESTVALDPGLPPGSDLGLGNDDPISRAGLTSGEKVVDLGSGPGGDVFRAALQVGPEGYVIGVDMSENMLEGARKRAAEGGFSQVEFRQGLIEALPVEDRWADVVLSNCVVNLSPEKQRVIEEFFRVLEPGGRFSIADIVRTAPEQEKKVFDEGSYCGCIEGAIELDAYLGLLKSAGFRHLEVHNRREWKNLSDHASVVLTGRKPD